MASTPTHAGEKKDDHSTTLCAEGRSAGDRTPGLQEPTDTPKTVGSASQVAGGTSVSALQLATNFIRPDLAAKFTLVHDLVKSWT